MKITKAELFQHGHSQIIRVELQAEFNPCRISGQSCPMRALKTPFPPQIHPKSMERGGGYSQVLQGDLGVQLLHHLPGQQQRNREKQQETEKIHI